MTEAGGVCYLVELGGNLDTMDWDTGEVSTYWKQEKDAQWITDDALRTACYLDGQTLHWVDLATGTDRALGTLEHATELKAVTEHYVIYECWEWNADGTPGTWNGVWYVNAETMEETPLFRENGKETIAIAELNGTFGIRCGEDQRLLFGFPETEDGGYSLLKVNFSTGEKQLVAELPGVMMAAGLWQDTLLYLDATGTLYSVPIDGSGEPEARAFTPDLELGQVIMARMNSDGTMIAVCGDEKTQVYGYDPETDTAWLLEETELDSVSFMARTDRRYAVSCMVNGREQIILDDWNPPST